MRAIGVLLAVWVCAGLLARMPNALAQTAQPTPTPSPEGVRLNVAGVARSARLVAAPPLPTTRSWLTLYGLPAHWRVLFDDAPLSPEVDPRIPQMFIVPLDDYRAVFRGGATNAFTQTLAALSALLDAPSPLIAVTEDWTLLPLSECSNVMQALVSRVNFNNGRGVRWVTHFTQEIRPITADQLTYVFQGVTDDRRLFVAAYFPLQTDVLPSSPSELSASDRDLLRSDYQQYLAEVAANLKMPTAVFTPSLRALDAMMTSVQIDADALLKAQAPAARLARTSDLLNLRAAPSTRAAVITTLPRGFEVMLMGRSNDNRWALVRLRDGRTGWVSAQYLEPRSAINGLPVIR